MRVRNPKIQECYRSLKQTESLSLRELKDLQLRRLKVLLEKAYAKSPYYRELFDRHGVRVADIRTLDDLARIPVSTKDDVLANAGRIQIADCGEKTFYSETSGSTGKPLVFYRNREWDGWANAAVMRGYSWHGVSPWERNGYLWGYNIAPRKRLKVRLLDALQNRFRMFSYKGEDIDRFVRKLSRADFLEGYSSMLYEVAKRVNAAGTKHRYRLKLVKGTSEKIFDSYQEEVRKAFGRKIVSEYGSAETGIIAFECAAGKMHVTMETVIVEDPDGELVVTNLVSNSFPIIRYKLGDSVRVDRQTRCSCGMAHEIVDEVTGRIGQVIHGAKEQYPSLTLYYVFKNLAMNHNVVLNYQVIQEQKGAVLVNIENDFVQPVHELLLKEFGKYFGSDLEVQVTYQVPRSDFTRKRKDFVSLLDPARQP
jgi:phenylacetate-CoA ligase